MKKPVYLILCLILMVQSTLPVYGQLENDFRSYYVVIGAFAIKRNAINFTAKAAKTYPAKFEMNRSRNLDYVYILKTDDKQVAVDEAMRLRGSTSYDDTWVYHGVLGMDADITIRGRDINPATEQKIRKVSLADNLESELSSSANQETERKGTRANEVESKVTKSNEAGSNLAKENEAVAERNEPESITEPEDPNAKSFWFKISRVDNNVTIEGVVDVIDTERARKIGTYDGNVRVNVKAPVNPEGGVSLICEVFGYRKVQRDINYSNPEGEDITSENGATVVPFQLMRLQKGDIATMFHVYFFSDAAVMRPESRYEVNSLLEMMQENPKYKIRIHGHTNGKASGKITSLNNDADNYFSLNNTRDGYGSAKKLSLLRSEMMRDYLVSNGIDAKRLQVKAWGGKKPIVDKFHAQAQSNLRVEIEILEH